MQLKIINKEMIIKTLLDLSLMKFIGLLLLLNNRDIISANAAKKGADGNKIIPIYSAFKPTLLNFVLM